MSRRTTAFFFLAAGLVTLAGMLATPWESEQTTASYLSAYVGHETQGQIAAVLLHFGYLLLVPAVFGLIVALREHGGKLRAVGGTLAVLGWATLPGMLVVDFYAMTLVDRLPLEQAVAIEDAAASMPGAAVIGITGALPAFVGLFLLLLSAARAKVVPMAAPALVVAAIVLTIGAGGVGAAMIGGTVLLLVAFALVARGLAPARDDLRVVEHGLGGVTAV